MDEGGAVGRKKRPGWVWAICIYYSLSLISGAVVFYLNYFRTGHTTAVLQQYYASWNMLHWFVVAIGYVLSWSAVVALFMMKRVAVRLWLLLVMWLVLDDLEIGASAQWRAFAGVEGLVGLVVGVIIVVAIYFYSRKLDARGDLA